MLLDLRISQYDIRSDTRRHQSFAQLFKLGRRWIPNIEGEITGNVSPAIEEIVVYQLKAIFDMPDGWNILMGGGRDGWNKRKPRDVSRYS